MICPACQATLEVWNVEGVEVDVCNGGCGGFWLDNHELRHLKELPKGAGASLRDVDRNPHRKTDNDQKRRCPRCTDQPMMKQIHRGAHLVTLDNCPQCGGHWVDTGELQPILNASPPPIPPGTTKIEPATNWFGGKESTRSRGWTAVQAISDYLMTPYY